MARKLTAQQIVAIAEQQAQPAPVATYPGVGRPSQLTQVLADRIADYVGRGLEPTTAARRSGVPRQTFERWARQGKHDDDLQIDSIYAYLWASIDQKEADCEGRWVEDAASGRMGWQGPATMASRKFPDRWADKPPPQSTLTVIVGGDKADVTVNVIANYQTQTESVALTGQSLAGGAGGSFAGESEGRKLLMGGES